MNHCPYPSSGREMYKSTAYSHFQSTPADIYIRHNQHRFPFSNIPTHWNKWEQCYSHDLPRRQKTVNFIMTGN